MKTTVPDTFSPREYEFVGALEKAYGKEGRAYFQDITTAKRGMYIFAPSPVGSEWWRSEIVGRVRVDGNKGRCYDPVLHRECAMIRSGSAWQICLELGDSAACAWDIGYCNMIAGVARKCMPEIGKLGVTIDDIRLKLGDLEQAGSDTLGPRPPQRTR